MISIDAQELSKAIKRIRPAISRKSTLPSAQLVQVHISGQKLVLAATDLETSVKITLQIQKPANRPVSFGVNPELLSAALLGIKSRVEINIPDDNGNIGIGEGISIERTEGEELPYIPSRVVSGKVLGFKNLDYLLGQVDFAMETDNCRPTLNAVCLNNNPVSGKGRMIAADGFRLAIYPLEIAFTLPQILIPRKTVAILKKVFKGVPTVLFQEPNKESVMCFHSGNVDVFRVNPLGTYPKVDDLIPSYTKETTFEVDALLAAFTQLEPVAKGNGIVRLILSEQRIVASASDDNNKMSLTIPAHGVEGQIAFNLTFLKESLSKLGKQASMKFNSDSTPAVFKSLDEGNYSTHVVMPMYVQW